jgi:hypothetical protein
MKAVIFYSVLPSLIQSSVLGGLIAWHCHWISKQPFSAGPFLVALFYAPAFAAFLFAGVILLPYLAVYILSLIARRATLAKASRSRLFARGLLNPLPSLSLFWMATWISFLRFIWSGS